MKPKHAGSSNKAMNSKIKTALKAKLKETEELKKQGRDPINFTRILLKFQIIRKVIKRVQRVFTEYDKDKDGHITFEELQDALVKLQVKLTREEIRDLFNLSDLMGYHTLNLKEFLVALTVGYVLEVIPDLLAEAEERANNMNEMSVMIRNAPEEYELEEERSMTMVPSSAGNTVRRRPKRRRRSSNFYGLEQELCYVMHLIVGCYLLFDTKGRGYIRRRDVGAAVRERGGKEGSASGFFSEERWGEMDWDHNGSISFEEFVYAFTRWVDVDDEDEADFAERAQSGGGGGDDPASAKRKLSRSKSGARSREFSKSASKGQNKVSSKVVPGAGTTPAAAAAPPGAEGGGERRRSSILKSGRRSSRFSASSNGLMEAAATAATKDGGVVSSVTKFEEDAPNDNSMIGQNKNREGEGVQPLSPLAEDES
eukprot:CAMPEP_0194587726 /NCGR_PEP_ID=MMETSP0292-20121207/19333_1 /TAXON_ID=39354 /ORGANISM="Heterosigma akashiwo, Strain CCMP2393" /LENGTH=425 /DNA_ID=CAMNT_0039444047 /DNA_START=89 /DNA_END=1366 /DNA_ORIENTATION=+